MEKMPLGSHLKQHKTIVGFYNLHHWFSRKQMFRPATEKVMKMVINDEEKTIINEVKAIIVNIRKKERT